MKTKNTLSYVSAGLLGMASVSVLTGCEVDQIQAVVDGVDLVAGRLVDLENNSSSHEDISFGDWLLDELRE